MESVFRELSEAEDTMTGKQVERVRAQFLELPSGGHFGPNGYPPQFVEAIYNDYMDHGEVLAAIAPRWRRKAGSLGQLLAKWELREKTPELTAQIKARQRDKGGRMMAESQATPAELEEIIAAATKMAIPPALRWEFKNWTMEKRAWFVGRLRARLKSPKDRPETPFSKNVEPFDYTTPRARAIKDRLNAGLSSQQAICRIDLSSQGVIYRDDLWYWAGDCYCKRGAWTVQNKRPVLSRVIWEEYNGPVPPGHVVRFSDGNRNNLTPENLYLATKDDVCRETQAAGLSRKSRELTTLLLQRSQQVKGKKHGLIESLKAA